MLVRAVLTCLTLVLGVHARADVCAECRVEDDIALLCALHAEAEAKVVDILATTVLSEDEGAALGALEQLSRLTAAHENAPSPAVAHAMARALEHDSFKVRTEALRRLRAGEDPAVAREAFLSTLETWSGLVDGAAEALDEGYSGLLDEPARARDPLMLQLQGMGELSALLQALVREAQLGMLAEPLFGYLGQGDDRALDRLVAVASLSEGIGAAYASLGPALCAQGRRDAVEAAVALTDDWQDRASDYEAALSKLERRSLPRRPSGFSGTKEQFEEAARKERNGRVAYLRLRVQNHETQGRALHDALGELARARALGDAPEWNGKPYTVWRSWLQRHRAELPERLDPAPADD